jgi:hypothetical protein
MKKSNKPKPKPKFIKELAGQFEVDLANTLPISIQPNGDIVYKEFVIKLDKFKNWALHYKSGPFIEQFYLKTCALMAARYYHRLDLNKFNSIKQLDRHYWSHYCDTLVFKNNIAKKTIDYDRYLILLNKLEYSQDKSNFYKNQISQSFKWTFAS